MMKTIPAYHMLVYKAANDPSLCQTQNNEHLWELAKYHREALAEYRRQAMSIYLNVEHITHIDRLNLPTSHLFLIEFFLAILEEKEFHVIENLLISINYPHTGSPHSNERKIQGLLKDFSRGDILIFKALRAAACCDVVKLGGSGACPPRKNFEFYIKNGASWHCFFKLRNLQRLASKMSNSSESGHSSVESSSSGSIISSLTATSSSDEDDVEGDLETKQVSWPGATEDTRFGEMITHESERSAKKSKVGKQRKLPCEEEGEAKAKPQSTTKTHTESKKHREHREHKKRVKITKEGEDTEYKLTKKSKGAKNDQLRKEIEETDAEILEKRRVILDITTKHSEWLKKIDKKSVDTLSGL